MINGCPKFDCPNNHIQTLILNCFPNSLCYIFNIKYKCEQNVTTFFGNNLDKLSYFWAEKYFLPQKDVNMFARIPLRWRSNYELQAKDTIRLEYFHKRTYDLNQSTSSLQVQIELLYLCFNEF